jgi:cardiolipin synthase C
MERAGPSRCSKRCKAPRRDERMRIPISAPPAAPPPDTRLGRACVPLHEARPGHSGVFALSDPREAFAARALLADAAERTLDVQYYIWRADMSGTLLAEALRRAADRGVRVRLLLDDNNTASLDTVLSAFDQHPNIEIRLFNPFRMRRWRLLSYLVDFARLNRRMHNKSFTVDGQATIIGGRNVGDEYFGAGHDFGFIDLDVLAIGPVVADVARDFERYWTSASSLPVASVLPTASPEALAEVAVAAARVERDPAATAYLTALGTSSFVEELLVGALPFEWATVHMVSDDPAKGLGRAREDQLLWTRLRQVVGTPSRALQLVSPYFVPGTTGVRELAEFARQGVAVSVLTNALEATDVAAVHAGYAKRRKALLEAGVALFELRRSGGAPSARGRGIAGSSASSLHAKTFAIDGARLFVGSFNFDPRSQRLNTELGFVIDSPAMAQFLADAFATSIPAQSYKVGVSEDGRLQWEQRRGEDTIVFAAEPGAGLWKRMMVAALSLLPIEWLL